MCGIVGITSQTPVASAIALGLQAVQHRGQDAAGIGVYNDQQFNLYKGVGLVSAIISPSVIKKLQGNSGVGHVRYPTVGSNSEDDAQPFFNEECGVLLSHNGNITNVEEVREYISNYGMKLNSTCDAELILDVLCIEMKKRQRSECITKEEFILALQGAIIKLRGGYSINLITVIDNRETLVAFKDPHGIRPLLWGEYNGGFITASESVSLDPINYKCCGHIGAGEVGFFVAGEQPSFRKVLSFPSHRCIFEDIYFARPDSLSESGRIYFLRRAFGKKLAEQLIEKEIEADVVVAVPDTSKPSAAALGEVLSLPVHEGFIKNRYSTRTFIMPTEEEREAALLLKLNPIPEVLTHKRVILVDDSIVRGMTMKRIVGLLRNLQIKEIHLAIVSPPVLHPCFYGIDMPSYDELIAPQYSPVEKKLREFFGVDSLTYLSQKNLNGIVNAKCAACFTGEYPVPISQKERLFFSETRRAP